MQVSVQAIGKDLEDWIEKNLAILDDDLLVISRQLSIEGVGRLDLLCMDSFATLVIVEIKRNLRPRDAVAQALDYASWVNDADESESGV
jgi:RecB family endonuclease NucS